MVLIAISGATGVQIAIRLLEILKEKNGQSMLPVTMITGKILSTRPPFHLHRQSILQVHHYKLTSHSIISESMFKKEIRDLHLLELMSLSGRVDGALLSPPLKRMETAMSLLVGWKTPHTGWMRLPLGHMRNLRINFQQLTYIISLQITLASLLYESS